MFRAKREHVKFLWASLGFPFFFNFFFCLNGVF